MERLFLFLCCEFLVFAFGNGHTSYNSNGGNKNIFSSYDDLLNLFGDDQILGLQSEVFQQLGDSPTHEEWKAIFGILKNENTQPVSVWKPHFRFLFNGVGYAKHPTGNINLVKKTYANYQEPGKILNTLSVTFFTGTANISSPEEMVGATGTFGSYTFTEVTPTTVGIELISASTMFLKEHESYVKFGSKITVSRSSTFKLLDATFSMTKNFFSVEETATGVTKRKGERNLVGVSFGKNLPHFLNGTDAISDSKTGLETTSRISGSLPSEGKGNYALYIASKVVNEISDTNDFLEMAVHGYCDFPPALNKGYLPEMFVD